METMEDSMEIMEIMEIMENSDFKNILMLSPFIYLSMNLKTFSNTFQYIFVFV